MRFLVNRASFLLSAVILLAFPAQLLSQTSREGHTASINGMEMFYETVGEGNPLVLLHGFLETGHLFDPFVEELAQQYRLIIPDLRGHGGSTNPSGEFTMRQSALDIYALLDHLDIDQVRAVGISTGAMTLLHMATQQPTRVEAMVLVGSGMYYPDTCREQLAGISADSYSERGWKRLKEIHRHGDDQIRALLDLFGGFANDYTDMAFTADDLSAIEARTFLVHGDRDWCFPVTMVTQIYEAIPTAYLWVVPNGGHVPIMGSRSAQFTESVLAFLAESWDRR